MASLYDQVFWKKLGLRDPRPKKKNQNELWEKKKTYSAFFSVYWQALELNSCRWKMLDKRNMEIWGRSWNEEARIMEIAVPSGLGYSSTHSKLRGQIHSHSSCYFLPSHHLISPLSINSFFFLVLQSYNCGSLFCSILSFSSHTDKGFCCPWFLLALFFYTIFSKSTHFLSSKV